jgi:CBS domain-containing protein
LPVVESDKLVGMIARADLVRAVAVSAEKASPAAGKLSLPIYETYPLDDIAEALALMRSNQHFGKLVISIR